MTLNDLERCDGRYFALFHRIGSFGAVLYQVLSKQVPVPVPVPVVQVPVQVPVPNLQVPVPVQVVCINYRHSVTLQLHKVKVVAFIFKKRTVRTNELQTQCVVKSVTTVFFGFGWLVATPAASQQHKKIFFLATSTLLQVPVPVPVPVQVPVLLHASISTMYQYPKNVLKYNLSTSTSTKYNKTALETTICQTN